MWVNGIMVFLGVCSYAECEPDEWTSWSTSCGKGTRQRNIQQVAKTIEKYSCDSLPQSCPTKIETEERNELCK